MTSFNLAITVGSRCVSAVTAHTGSEGVVVEQVGLGAAGTAPSIAVMNSSGELVFGDAAEHCSAAQPQRTIRDLQQRVGDDVPLMVGGRLLDAAQVYAQLIAWVVERSTEQLGTRPCGVTIGHPADWGEYRLGLIAVALAQSGVDGFDFMALPDAAIAQYEVSSPLSPGELIAVYDLGGDGLTCTVLRKERDGGLTQLGSPGGLSSLGGADFDDLVFGHVLRVSGLAASGMDTRDPLVSSCLVRLRDACTLAKEQLSSETAVTIPVVVPPLDKSVRLTRSEFEQMIEPALDRSIDALDETLERAGIEADRLQAICLIGGSSRIPRIAQRLSEVLDRPIVIEADPRLSAACGAARSGLGLAEQRAQAMASLPDEPEADGEADVPHGEPSRRPAGRPGWWRRKRGGLMIVTAALVTLLVTGSSAAMSGSADQSGSGPSSSRPDFWPGQSTPAEDEAADLSELGALSPAEDPSATGTAGSSPDAGTRSGSAATAGANLPEDEIVDESDEDPTTRTAAPVQPGPEEPEPEAQQPPVDTPPAESPTEPTDPEPTETAPSILSPPESGI